MAILDRIFRRDFRLKNGKVQQLTGKTNVRDALKNRFSVFPGSIPFRPNYGTNLKRFSNEPMTKELEHQIVKEVREQVERDPRVNIVRKITINTTQEGLLEIDVEVVLVSEDENINFRVIV